LGQVGWGWLGGWGVEEQHHATDPAAAAVLGRRGAAGSGITPPIRRLRQRWGRGERLHAADPAAAAALGRWGAASRRRSGACGAAGPRRVDHFGRPGVDQFGRPAPASVDGAVAWDLGPGSGGGWITLAALRVDQFGRPLTLTGLPKIRCNEWRLI
jgi:hypothetical protein